jgi:ribosome biogenesis GTPase A
MRVRYSYSSRRTGRIKNIKKQRKKYPIILDEIVSCSDIILEVLDARFPKETRNKEIEESIKKLEKKIIFVLNKSDLIESQKRFKGLSIFVSCKDRKGIKKLRDLIKFESKRIKKIVDKDKLGKVVIGIIGYPNTGKSSLINLLIGKKSAGTGDEPGFTKGIQKIKLSKEVVLLDSPGVIPEKKYSSIEIEKISSHVKTGARSHSHVKNPEFVVAEIMKENPGKLEKYYGFNTKGDSEVLIYKLGKKYNFLKKGGVVDEDKTSRKILKDFQEGKIGI